MDVAYPVPGQYAGNITTPFVGAYPSHDGVDFGVGDGNTTVPCMAAADGTVQWVKTWFTSYGHQIQIDHGRGVSTRYCHLAAGSFRVKPGDRVSAGQRIATVGSTGNSSGEHLHFMVLRSGQVVNPLAWLQNAGATRAKAPVPGADTPEDTPREPLPKLPDAKPGTGRSRLGLGDDTFTLNGKPVDADLADVVTEATLNLSVGQVAELQIKALSPNAAKRAATLKGATLGWDSARWDISAVSANAATASVDLFARSRLARRLRRHYRVVGEHKVQPDQWITRVVQGAGGHAIVQRATQRAAIPEDKRQSLWDAIAGLCSDMNWDWVEYGGTVIAGRPSWAAAGGPGLPTWPVTWHEDPASDALDATLSLTDDSPRSAGSGDLALPWPVARRIRVWHRVRLAGFGAWDGMWLVDAISISNDGTSPATVTVRQPRASADDPPRESSSTTGTSVDDVRSLLPSGYRLWRSPAAAVAAAQRDIGRGGTSRRCLEFVGTWYGGMSRGMQLAIDVWRQAPDRMKHPRDTSAPLGALVCWGTGLGAAGHIALSIGGGRMITTGVNGGRVAQMRIADYSPSNYLGWMPPYFAVNA